MLVIQTTFDLHLLGGEDSSSTSRTGSLGILRGDLGGVAVHQGGLALREGLLEAMATVYFSILSLVDIVEALERFGAFEAGETLGVPGALLRQLSLHLESFPSAPPAGGRVFKVRHLMARIAVPPFAASTPKTPSAPAESAPATQYGAWSNPRHSLETV